MVIGACIEVHRVFGPGLLESAYQACLAHELTLRGLSFERQKALPVSDKEASNSNAATGWTSKSLPSSSSR